MLGLLSPTGRISQLVSLGAFLKSQVLVPCGLRRFHPSQPVGYGSAPAPWFTLSVRFPVSGAAFVSWEISGDTEP